MYFVNYQLRKGAFMDARHSKKAKSSNTGVIVRSTGIEYASDTTMPAWMTAEAWAGYLEVESY